MSPKTFLLVGRSGAGKGTQARLLNEYIKQNDKDNLPLFYVETGEHFRRFISEKGYSNELAAEFSQNGLLQPDFLAIWNWSDLIVKNLQENMHLVMDGTPRSLPEAEVLETAFTFYKRKESTVIYVNVSGDWSKEHMKKRGRTDDSHDSYIDTRLAWFDTRVLPAIEYYKKSRLYTFIEINGEQPIEKIHEEIIKSIKW